MNNEESVLTIRLDGVWLLSDLGRMPDDYARLYAFIAHVESWRELESSIVPVNLPIVKNELAVNLGRLWFPYESSGTGGKGMESADVVGSFTRSPVNRIFSMMERNLRADARPRVLEIQYASPGYIDVVLWSAIAALVGRSIKAAVQRGREINSLYDEVKKNAHSRRIRDFVEKERELNVAEKEIQFLKKATKDLATLVRLNDEYLHVVEKRLVREPPAAQQLPPQVSQLEQQTRTAQIVLAAVGQIRRLAGLQQERKATFD